MKTEERYPELAGFTERLLEGLTETLAAERARPGGGRRSPRPWRARQAGVRRYAVPAVGLAAVVAVLAAGLTLDRSGGGEGTGRAGGDQAGPATAGAPGPSGQAAVAAPVRTLGELALVAERQPAPGPPAGPVREVRTETLVGGLYDGQVDGKNFAVEVERRRTETYRSDGSMRFESGAPTAFNFPTKRDRVLFDRWYARMSGDPDASGKAFAFPYWPEAATFTGPADPQAGRDFERDHNSGKLGYYQATSGEMVGILPIAELPADPAALKRTVQRAVEPFAADSSAEQDMVGKVGTRRELFVATVYDLLTNDTVRPKVRAAALRMLEGVEGVTVVPDAADRSGRRGIGIRWDDTRNGPSSPTLWVFDRKRSGLLGTESTLDLTTGEREHYTVVLRHEVVR